MHKTTVKVFVLFCKIPTKNMSTSSADLLGLRAHFGSPMNRIQKLLLSDEYATFDDTVLVESPFAQVTADGIGLRQVQLGGYLETPPK